MTLAAWRWRRQPRHLVTTVTDHDRRGPNSTGSTSRRGLNRAPHDSHRDPATTAPYMVSTTNTSVTVGAAGPWDTRKALPGKPKPASNCHIHGNHDMVSSTWNALFLCSTKHRVPLASVAPGGGTGLCPGGLPVPDQPLRGACAAGAGTLEQALSVFHRGIFPPSRVANRANRGGRSGGRAAPGNLRNAEIARHRGICRAGQTGGGGRGGERR